MWGAYSGEFVLPSSSGYSRWCMIYGKEDGPSQSESWKQHIYTICMIDSGFEDLSLPLFWDVMLCVERVVLDSQKNHSLTLKVKALQSFKM